jgi:YHS domain-containing protein
MLRIIIWAVLLIVIGRMVWRFVYAVFDGAGMLKGSGQRERAAVKLVRDPICGVFVVPDKALTSGSGTATRYFCSEKCRDQWGRR